MDVEGIIDDKVSIPQHGKVNWEVTDVTALVVILINKKHTEKVTCTGES